MNKINSFAMVSEESIKDIVGTRYFLCLKIQLEQNGTYVGLIEYNGEDVQGNIIGMLSKFIYRNEEEYNWGKFEDIFDKEKEATGDLPFALRRENDEEFDATAIILKCENGELKEYCDIKFKVSGQVFRLGESGYYFAYSKVISIEQIPELEELDKYIITGVKG